MLYLTSIDLKRLFCVVLPYKDYHSLTILNCSFDEKATLFLDISLVLKVDFTADQS